MKLGLIASGSSAGELAGRLAGASLAGTWAPDAAARADLKAHKARSFSSAVDLARECDVVLVSLSESAAVDEVLFGSAGVGEALAKNSVVVDLSPGTRQAARDTAQRLAAKGIQLVDAALLSSPAQAAPADLTVVVSGPDAAWDTALPALQAISPNVIRCGTLAGDAQVVRLIDRAMTVSSALGSLESVAAGRKMGLSLRSMTEVFVKGSGRNYTTRFLLPAIAEGRTALDVTLGQAARDVNAVVAAGMACGIPTPIASIARSLLQSAVNALGEDAPFQELGKAVASMAGTHLPDAQGASNSVGKASEASGTVTLGYVGLGAMGAPLARRLMLSYKVHAYDVRPGAAEALAAEGAVAAPDLATLARNCDVILLCVPSSAIVREVLFGKGGLAEGLSPGKIVIDQTTGDPDEAVAIADQLRKLGVPLVDAPVSGGPETPPLGTAAMICGGEPDVFERVLPILKAIGPTVTYCGPVGSGHAAKLVNNASNICNRLIAYEAAMLGFKLGLPLDVFHQAVNKSTGWSFAAERVFKAVATHGKTASISLELSLKDIASAVKMGIGCGAPMLVGDMARNLFAMGVHQFGGNANVDEMAKLYERMSSIDFTKR
jgi:3-hydroxyisobutyrate dehydrogenase